MMWLDDDGGDLVNITGARFIGVREIEDPEPKGPTHAVMVIWPDGDSAWLFAGTEAACIEFRNGLRSALRGHDTSLNPKIIEALSRG